MNLQSRIYLAAVVLCGLIQVVIGAPIQLVVCMVLISAALAWPLNKKELYPTDLLYMSLSVYFAGFALVAKTLVGQPLDQNLFAPELSTLILGLSFASVTVGYAVVNNMFPRLGPPMQIGQTFNSTGFLQFFSKAGFIAGAMLTIAHAALRPHFLQGSNQTSEGVGALGSFYFLMPLAFSAQIALCSLSKNRQREILIAALMLAVIFFTSIVENVKKNFIDGIYAVALSLYVFRFRLRPIYIGGGIAVLFFVAFVAEPIIHIVRAQQTTSPTITERLDGTMRVLETNNYDLFKINSEADVVAKSYGEFRDVGTYFYPLTLSIDRFCFILPVDQVARAADHDHVSVAGLGRTIAEQILPSFMIKKSAGVLADYVAWQYGFRAPDIVGRPVVGVAASSYAVGGLVAVLLLPGLLWGGAFYILSKMSGSLRVNPGALGIAVNISQFAEKEVDAIITFFLHDMLVLVVVMFMLVRGYDLITGNTARNTTRKRVAHRGATPRPALEPPAA